MRDGKNTDHTQGRPKQYAREAPMAGAIGELDVIIAGLVEVNALEGAIDGENRFSFAIRRGDKVSGLAFGQTDNAGFVGANIEGC